MPFRQASRELEFFTRVEISEGTIRKISEDAGEAQVKLQEECTALIQANCQESPPGPDLQMMSVDGAFIRLVGGEWREVKTVALGVVAKEVEPDGQQKVHTQELSYFSRMSEARKFEQEALVEIYERGVEKAGKVCAVTDGAEWIQAFVDMHRVDAIRILDFAHTIEYVADVGKAVWERGLAAEFLKDEKASNSAEQSSKI
jgi:hypothetical protein